MPSQAETIFHEIEAAGSDINKRIAILQDNIDDETILDTLKMGELILFKMNDDTLLVFTDDTQESIPGVTMQWYSKDRAIALVERMHNAITTTLKGNPDE